MQLVVFYKQLENWKRFYEAWKNDELVTGLINQEMNIRLATFLSIIGADGMQKYASYKTEYPEEMQDLDKVIKQFALDCECKTNVLYEQYQFLRWQHQTNKTIGELCNNFVYCATLVNTKPRALKL